jgi:hypothetical protein
MSIAVGTQDLSLWEAVALVLDKLTTEDKKGSVEPHVFHQLFIKHFPEFGPAQREFSYQRQVARVNTALDKATADFHQTTLERHLTKAQELNTQASFNRIVDDTKAMLEDTMEVRKKIESGIESVDYDALVAGTADAEAFNFDSPLVTRARKYQATLDLIQDATAEQNQSKFGDALRQAMELHMNESKMINDTRELLNGATTSRLKGVVEVVEDLEAAIRSKGTNNTHLAQLERVVQLVDQVGGLQGTEEIDQVRKLMDRLREEAKLTDDLKSACAVGGWSNTDVKQGDYEFYQANTTIDWTGLQTVLDACRRLEDGMKTELGRMYFRLGKILLPLRQKLYAAIGTQDGKCWREEWTILDEIAFSGEESSKSTDGFSEQLFIEHFPEITSPHAWQAPR